MAIFRRSGRLRTLSFLLGSDVAAVFLAFLSAYAVIALFDSRLDPLGSFVRAWPAIAAIAALHVLCLYAADCYRLPRRRWDMRYHVRLVVTLCVAGILSSGFLFFVPEYILGRRAMLLNIFALAPLLVAFRELARVLVPQQQRRLAVIARLELVDEYRSHLAANDRADYRLVDAVALEADQRLDDVEADLFERLRRHDVDVLAIDTTLSSFSPRDVHEIVAARRGGLRAHDAHELFKDISGRFSTSGLTPQAVLAALARAERAGFAYHRTKRLLDLAVSSVLLVLLAPLMILTALAIRLDSPGPSLFRQLRLGERGVPFMCLKFRSMVVDAERGSGPLRTAPADPRVTRVGAIIRATKIDELPQLLNVLAGQMSLVGPRPIREHFVLRWREEVPLYDLRLLARPGVTGWAQVTYDAPEAATEEDQVLKFCHDLFYLERQSLLLDLYTLLRTLRHVIGKAGLASTDRGHMDALPS